MRGALVLLLGVVGCGVGCSLDAVSLEGKACPCLIGWHCDETRNVCERGPADAGSGTADVGVDDAGSGMGDAGAGLDDAGAGMDADLDAAHPADAPADAAPDAHAPSCDDDDAIVLYGFADPGASLIVPDDAVLDPDVPLSAAPRDPVGVSFDADGVTFSGGQLTATAANSLRLEEAILTAGSFTVEVWFSADDATQVGPARMITLSPDTCSRAFMLGQDGDAVRSRIRTSGTDSNGADDLAGLPIELAVPGVFPAARRHVAFLWSAVDAEARIYVDGRISGSTVHRDAAGDPAVLNWDTPPVCSCCDRTGNLLAVGEENNITPASPRRWLGTVHRVAIYDRVLSDDEIWCQYEAFLGAD